MKILTILWVVLLTVSISVSHANTFTDILKQTGEGISTGIKKVGDKVTGKSKSSPQNLRLLEEFEDFLLVEGEFIADQHDYVNSLRPSKKSKLESALRESELPYKRISKKIELHRADWNKYVSQQDAMLNLYTLKADYLTAKQAYEVNKKVVASRTRSSTSRTSSVTPSPRYKTTGTNNTKVASSVNATKSKPSNQHAALIQQGCQMGRDDANSGKVMDSTAISLKNAGSKYIKLEARIRNEYEKCYKGTGSVTTKTTLEEFPSEIAHSEKNPSDSSSSVSNLLSHSSKRPKVVTEQQYRQAKSEISSFDNRLLALDNKLSYLNRLEKELADWRSWPLSKGQINHTEAQRKRFIEGLERGLEAQEERLKGELAEKERLLKEKEDNIQTVSLYIKQQEQNKVVETNKEIERYIDMLSKKGIDLSETALPTTLEESESLLSMLSTRLNEIEEAELKKQQIAQQHNILKTKILLLQDKLEKSGEDVDRTVDISTYSLAKRESENLQNKIDALEGPESQTGEEMIGITSSSNEVSSTLISNNLITTLTIIVVVGFIIILIAGSTNKIVIYYDIKDFIISFMPWGSLLAGFILLDVYQNNGEIDFENLTNIQTLILSISIISSAIFAIWSIKLSISNNRSITLGLIVSVFKIVTSLLGIVILIGQLGKIFSPETSRKETFIAVLLFAFFIWLGDKLINGEDVYQAKGWLHQ